MDLSFCPTKSTVIYQKSRSERILKRLSEFYSRNRRYKTHFFHFSIFSTKPNQQNEFKFLEIKAIYNLHHHDFSPKD